MCWPIATWKAIATGKLDRLDVAYTQVRQRRPATDGRRRNAAAAGLACEAGDAEAPTETPAESMYEFLPSAASILEEVVPTSFKVKLFKCFLDAAVSEQIARMVAMKSGHRKRRQADQSTVACTTTAPAKARSPAKSWKSSAASKR